MCILDLLPPPPSVGIAELSGCKDMHESLCNQVTAVALKSKPPLGGKGPSKKGIIFSHLEAMILVATQKNFKYKSLGRGGDT